MNPIEQAIIQRKAEKLAAEMIARGRLSEREQAAVQLGRLAAALSASALAATLTLSLLGFAGLGRVGEIDERFIIGFGMGLVAAYAACAAVLQYVFPERLAVRAYFRVPSWRDLRRTGGEQLKQASFVVLAVVPLLAYAFMHNPLQIRILQNMQFPLGLKLSFFASFLIIMGSAVVTAFGPRDDNGPLPKLTKSRLFLRAVSWTCYLGAFWLAVVIAVRAALLVLRA
jgi:hypothetical protein